MLLEVEIHPVLAESESEPWAEMLKPPQGAKAMTQ